MFLVALPLGAAEPPAGWKSFSSQGGAFTIAFPEAPREQKETIQGADGSGKVDQIQYLVGKPDGAYLASYQPAENLARADAKTIADALDSARDRLAATFQGKVLSTKDVKVGKTSGKEVLVDCPNIQGMIRSRMFLANGRFYQLMLIGTKGFLSTSEAAYFLDSFQPVE
jgi:hypothetical protein